MDELFKALGNQPDPNNPLAAPPISGRELMLRALASTVPPPGQLQVPNTALGRVGGVAARFGAGAAGALAEDMARRRLDPEARKLAAAQAALQAFGQIPRPTEEIKPPEGMLVAESLGIPAPAPQTKEDFSLFGPRTTGGSGISEQNLRPSFLGRGLGPPSVSELPQFDLYGGQGRPTINVPAGTRQRPFRSIEEALQAASPEQRAAVQTGRLLGTPADLFVKEPKFAAPGSAIVQGTEIIGQVPERTREVPSPGAGYNAAAQLRGYRFFFEAPLDVRREIDREEKRPKLFGMISGEPSLAKLDAAIALNKAIRKDAQGNAVINSLTGEPELDFTVLEKSIRDARNREAVGALNRIFQAYANREAGQATSDDEAVIRAVPSYLAAQGQTAAAQAGGRVTGQAGARGRPEVRQQEAGFAEAREAGASAGRPLGETAQTAIVTMTFAADVAQRLKSEFTPEQRAQYVGFLNFPTRRILQIAEGDPQFAQFQTLVNLAKSQAFGEGGKQLTPFEAGVVFGYVPTGTEFSAADFEAKLDEALKRSRFLINERLRLGTTPRGRLSAPPLFGGPQPIGPRSTEPR